MTDFHDSPPWSWKTIRVFISSTFRDMHAERDYLVKFVFPELREWCEKFRLHLVDIDLRWGVTAAEAESGKVIDICLEQIDGSRPFFICMLGNRYGWVPKAEEIPEDTRKRYDKIDSKKNFSVTHLEIQHAAFESLASGSSDDSAPHSFFYFREGLPVPESIKYFTQEERNAYAAVFFESESENIKRLDYLKKEIMDLFSPKTGKDAEPLSAADRVFSYKPEFNPELPNPEDDSLKGRLTVSSLSDFGNRVKKDLISALSKQYAVRIDAFAAKTGDDILQTELDLHESFVENRTRLFTGRAGLLKNLHEYVNGDYKKIFAVYGEPGCGKSALLAKFYLEMKYDKNGNRASEDTLVIPHFIGASPASSSLHHLLTRICREIYEKYAADELKERISHGWLTDQDEKDRILKEYEIPDDLNQLINFFRSFLSKTKGKVVIIIDGLNQLDENIYSHDLKWLPEEFNENVKIITSTLAGDTKTALQKITDLDLDIPSLTDPERREIIRLMPSVFCKTLEENHIRSLIAKEDTSNPLYLKVALDELRIFGSHEKLGQMIKDLPSGLLDLFDFVLNRLERDHGKDIVEKLFCLLECSRYGLTLGELKELMNDKDNTYLVILRQMRDYLLNRGELIDFFHRGLSKAVRRRYLNAGEDGSWHRTLAEYFMSLTVFSDDLKKENPNLRKLIEQPWQQTMHGDMFDEAASTLCDLWFVEAKVRSGMITELLDDYSFLKEKLPEYREQKDIEETKNGRIRKWITDIIEYAGRWSDARELYYNDPLKNPMPSAEDIPLPEMPEAEMPKTEQQIIEEINRIIENPTRLDRLNVFNLFIKGESHLLKESGAGRYYTIQHAYNYADSGPVAEQAERIIEKIDDAVFMLRHPAWRPRFNPRPAVLRTIPARFDYYDALCVTPDFRLAVTGDKIWDLELGVLLHTVKGNITSITPDGKKGISVEGIWDIEKGTLIQQFENIDKEITTGKNDNYCSLTPDGRLGIVCGPSQLNHGNYIFYIYDLSKNIILKKINILQKHGDWIQTILTPDGQSAFILISDTCYILDIQQCTVNVMNNFKTEKISSNYSDIRVIDTDLQGKFLLVANSYEYERNIIRLLDAKKLVLHNTFQGHWTHIEGISLNQEGNFFISTSHDRSIIFWDITGNIIKRFKKEFGVIRRTIINPFSTLLIIMNLSDLIVIDLADGMEFEAKNSHNFDLSAVTISSDAKYSISNGRPEFSTNHLMIWDNEIGKPIIQNTSVERLFKDNLSISSDNGIVYGTGLDGLPHLFDLRSQALIDYDTTDFKNIDKCIIMQHDSSILLTINYKGIIKLNYYRENTELLKFDTCMNITDILPSSCGRFCVIKCNYSVSEKEYDYYSSSILTKCSIWDLDNGTLLGTFNSLFHDYTTGDCIFSPDNRILYYKAQSGYIYKYDILTRKRSILSKNKNDNLNLFITPDGKYLLASSNVYNRNNSNAIHIINTEQNSDEKEIPVTGYINCVKISPDGNVFAYHIGNNLFIHSVVTGILISSCTLQSRIDTISDISINGTLTAGTSSGEVIYFRPKNLALSAPVITARRIWLFSKNKVKGMWDKNITACCPWCGEQFVVNEQIISAISNIHNEYNITLRESPVLKLPAEAWNDSSLQAVCPECRKELKFNPFICDLSNIPDLFKPDKSIYLKTREIYDLEKYRDRFNDELIDKGKDPHTEEAEKQFMKLFDDRLTKLENELLEREESDKSFTRKLLTDKFDETIIMEKIDFLTELELHSEAIRTFNELLLSYPGNRLIWKLKGVFLDENKRYDEAISCFDKALEIDPGYLDAMNNKGISLENISNFDEAMFCYNRILEIDPDYSYANRNKTRLENELENNHGYKSQSKKRSIPRGGWYKKGCLLFEKKKYREAAECFKKNLETDPDNDVILAKAGITVLLNDIRATTVSFDYFEAALKINPDNIDALTYKGYSLFHLDKYRESLNCLDKALSLGPENIDALFFKGAVLSGTGKYSEAINYYDRVLQLNPEHVHALALKGYSLYASGDDDGLSKMLSYAEHALAIEPENPEALFIKGTALDSIGRHEEALTIWENLCSDRYDLSYYIKPKIHCSLSKLNYERNIAIHEKILKENPDDFNSLMSLGSSLKNMFNDRIAFYYFDRAINQNPLDVHPYLNKAELYITLNETDNAIRCYEDALKKNPGNETINQKIINTKRLVADPFIQKTKKFLENIGIFSTADNLSEAIESYNQVLKIIPEDPQTEDLKNMIISRCIESAEYSIRFDNDDPMLYYNMALSIDRGNETIIQKIKDIDTLKEKITKKRTGLLEL